MRGGGMLEFCTYLFIGLSGVLVGFAVVCALSAVMLRVAVYILRMRTVPFLPAFVSTLIALGTLLSVNLLIMFNQVVVMGPGIMSSRLHRRSVG